MVEPPAGGEDDGRHAARAGAQGQQNGLLSTNVRIPRPPSMGCTECWLPARSSSSAGDGGQQEPRPDMAAGRD